MQISAASVKALREKTGAGVMDCRNTLLACDGNLERAEETLRQRGLAVAERKMNRIASQGLVEAYVHSGGQLGAMVELNCETDFVARTNEFKNLAHDLAMQVVATTPSFIGNGDFPKGTNLDAKETCLLLQPFIKNPDKTVQDIITETIAKVGENIKVKRFTRFELGE